VAGVDMAATAWEAEGDSVSIGMEDVSFVCLEAGGLVVAVREPRKVKMLPSCLEGPGFWPAAMVEGRVWPVGWGVSCGQERV